MSELPRQSNSDPCPCGIGSIGGCHCGNAEAIAAQLRHGWEDAARQLLEVEIANQPPGVRFYLEADGFSDALDTLNHLEFVELRTKGAGDNDGRRLAVHHSRIIGLFDPDWELLPEAPR